MHHVDDQASMAIVIKGKGGKRVYLPHAFLLKVRTRRWGSASETLKGNQLPTLFVPGGADQGDTKPQRNARDDLTRPTSWHPSDFFR